MPRKRGCDLWLFCVGLVLFTGLCLGGCSPSETSFSPQSDGDEDTDDTLPIAQAIHYCEEGNRQAAPCETAEDCEHEDLCGEAPKGVTYRCQDGACTGLSLDEDTVAMATLPAGSFWMGSYDNGTENPPRAWEGPYQEITLDAFQMDTVEVTNARYQACVEAGACTEPASFNAGDNEDYWTNPLYQDYPVLYVNWYEAQNYCQWVGKRLPTEEEWTRAVRGSADKRLYPWGNDLPQAEQTVGNLYRGGRFSPFRSDGGRIL